ncbi:sensor histidine kinase [Kocuria sabuli]|uniref:sensor histidine kinase n=1 Tax=Kocuria sabuli TaxID=3071448 RepID=UPI0034D7193B
MITWLRRPLWRLLGTVAVALMTGLVTLVLVRGSALPDSPEAVPEAEALRLSLILFGDLLAGLLAVAVLPFALRPLRDDADTPPLGARATGAGWALAAGLVVVAATALSTLAVPASLIVLVSFASRRPRAWFVASVAVLALAAWINAYVVEPGDPFPLWALLLFVLGVAGVAGLIGSARRSRRALVQSLRQEAAGARRERAAHIEQVRAAERTRIAREMHDTLSHRLSLISLHAGALEYRPDLGAHTVQQTSRVLRETARTASQELRTVLTVLREDGQGTSPDPGLTALEDLIVTARAAGTTVDLEFGGELAETTVGKVPAVTSRALYRITQECLTNARKHAPGQPVQLRVHGDRGEGITLTVTNPHTPAHTAELGGGFGLIGLQERVQLLEGRLHVQSTAEAFTVTAWLPWQN